VSTVTGVVACIAAETGLDNNKSLSLGTFPK